MTTQVLAQLENMDPATRQILQPYFSQPSADEWIRDVLQAYFAYFLAIGEQPESTKQAQSALRLALQPLVPTGNRRSLNRIEAALGDVFRRKGFYFLGGTTGPYYGPYVWQRTETRLFDVELPDRRLNLSVFIMHEFLIRSWMHFQTFGKHGTGGWVKRNESPWEDGLYCVASGYDLENVDTDLIFQVSLLKHEAQHFADLSDYPELRSPDLEYRAKLVELIYYPEMEYRLLSILREAAPLKADPHRFAAQQIISELSAALLGAPFVRDEVAWQSLPYAAIQAQSRQLLLAHTRQLEANPRNRRGVL